MIPENTHIRIVQDIRYEGPSPYIQYDILCIRSLLVEIERVAPQFYLNTRRLGRLLRHLEMLPIGLHFVGGKQCSVWTSHPIKHTREIVSIMRQRVKDGSVNLHMELVPNPGIPQAMGQPEPLPLLPTFERQILALRMQQQGLRYPRPREIAKKMDCAIFQVNQALQTIRRKLQIPTLKDAAMLRKAVRESGVLMDDPAFR